MDQSQVESCIASEKVIASQRPLNLSVSLESEIPELLYQGMRNFVKENPNLDQSNVISSALANFLFQNGCKDRAVTERYLNDLFNRSDL